MKAFLYIVAACTDPDHIDCKVPYRISDDILFFGPCKTRFRETIRRELLHARSTLPLSRDESYLVIGFKRPRKEQAPENRMGRHHHPTHDL